MKFPAMFIGGDVHLSRKTIKEILQKDFNERIKPTETMEGNEAVKEYIADLIYRLSHLEV